MKKSNKFSPEARERAVRMVQEHRGGKVVNQKQGKMGCGHLGDLQPGSGRQKAEQAAAIMARFTSLLQLALSTDGAPKFRCGRELRHIAAGFAHFVASDRH